MKTKPKQAPFLVTKKWSLLGFYAKSVSELYGEMQLGGGRQRAARELAEPTAQAFTGDIENARQNRAGIERRNGPGTRFAFAGQNKGLPQATIYSIQQIGEKSVNQFSSQEIQTVEPLARQYWNEMGTKSPFFRAWFGDWRQNDDSPVSVAKTAGSARGVISNDDTGWDINISGQVFNETNAHQTSGNRGAVPHIFHTSKTL